MTEIIFFIIFIFSLGGILFIVAKKIPVLRTLPQNGNAGIRDHHIILNIENRIKGIMLAFEKQIFLHKFLSWMKIMILKIETKIDHSLHNIRRKAQIIDKEIRGKK